VRHAQDLVGVITARILKIVNSLFVTVFKRIR